MQFDATYLSPSMALRADGTFGGLVPGATLRCNQDRNADPYDLEALTAAIQEASSTGVVAKCVHGLILVSLDHLQAPIPVAYCVSASGSVPAEFRVMFDNFRQHLLGKGFELCWPAFDGDPRDRVFARLFTFAVTSAAQVSFRQHQGGSLLSHSQTCCGKRT
jgi:hypothetical protein